MGDLDVLKEEINFYFEQLYLTKKNMDAIDHNGDLELVWNLIRNGDGLKSLMKQASLDQKEEEVRKVCFFKWRYRVWHYCISSMALVSQVKNVISAYESGSCDWW